MRELLDCCSFFVHSRGRCTRHLMNSRSTRDGIIEDPGRGNIGHLAMPGEHLLFVEHAEVQCGKVEQPEVHGVYL